MNLLNLPMWYNVKKKEGVKVPKLEFVDSPNRKCNAQLSRIYKKIALLGKKLMSVIKKRGKITFPN